MNFANDKWSRNQPPPEVRELTDANVWVDHCLGDGQDAAPKQICLVAFLPHILDSKAEGRNRYISMLKDISLSYKERPFSWFWVQGATQNNLEDALGVGYVIISLHVFLEHHFTCGNVFIAGDTGIQHSLH